MVKELPRPPGAHGDQSAEILRAWVTAQGLEVSLMKVWDRPDNWGILLVDLARHAARIFEREGVCSFDAAMFSMRKMFEAEWDRPTDLGETHARTKQ